MAGGVGIGDVDGDGRNDIVVADADGYINVYSEQPDGTDVLRYSADTGSGYDPFYGGLQLGDLTGDGIDEIVIGGVSSGIGIFRVVSGQLKGSLHATVPGQSIGMVGILDIDQDGKKDVVGLTWSVNVWLFYGDGKGGFVRRELMPGPQRGRNDMKVGDVTGDGLDDVVISTYQGFVFSILPVKPGGGFGPREDYENPENYEKPGDVIGFVQANAIGDFDSDGLNDVVLSNGANLPRSAIWLYRQGGNHALGLPTKLSTYDTPAPMVAADLDMDGAEDLLIVHQGFGEMSYWLQRGGTLVEGGRAPIVGYGASGADLYNNQGVAVGDFTGDGCPDVAIGDYNWGLVLVRAVGCPARKIYLPDETKSRKPL